LDDGYTDGKVEAVVLGATDFTTVGASVGVSVGTSDRVGATDGALEIEGFEDIEGASLGLSGMKKALIMDRPKCVGETHVPVLSGL